MYKLRVFSGDILRQCLTSLSNLFLFHLNTTQILAIISNSCSAFISIPQRYVVSTDQSGDIHVTVQVSREIGRKLYRSRLCDSAHVLLTTTSDNNDGNAKCLTSVPTKAVQKKISLFYWNIHRIYFYQKEIRVICRGSILLSS